MTTQGAPGSVVGGRYRLGPPLGQGGWGTVYEATQLDLDRRVAIKMLNQAALTDASGVSRFEREAKAAAALGHPNIVQVIDFVTVPGEAPFIVLEHLSGRTLAVLLRAERRLAPSRACAIARQVLSALEAAHRAGIVHRDVKPANIFLVAAAGVDDFVKLLDFGIAKLTGPGVPQLTGFGDIMGTPSYMSPEQIRGDSVDARTDVYAVGVMLYLAVSGRLPFVGDATEVMRAILTAPPQPLASSCPELDPRLVAVIERAMDKEPGRRFADASQMRASIEAIASTARSVPPTLMSAQAPQQPSHLSVSPTQVPTATSPPTHGATPAAPMMTEPSAAPRSRRSLVIGLAVAAVFVLGMFVAGVVAAVVLVRAPPPTTLPVAEATEVPGVEPPVAETASEPPPPVPASRPSASATSSARAASSTPPPRSTARPKPFNLGF